MKFCQIFSVICHIKPYWKPLIHYYLERIQTTSDLPPYLTYGFQLQFINSHLIKHLLSSWIQVTNRSCSIADNEWAVSLDSQEKVENIYKIVNIKNNKAQL